MGFVLLHIRKNMLEAHESEINIPVALPQKETVRNESYLSKLMGLLCSVRFGVVLLILLGLACFIGMLIMQQNVEGFDRYFAELTPAQRLAYGNLGLFDIYHAWYFNALLALLSLNIILASFERFPKTWRVTMRPKPTVPIHWLEEQKGTVSLETKHDLESIVENTKSSLTANGLRNITVDEKNGNTFVFGESGAWNRFGAYAVHVGLLTIFAGGFMTAQFGHTGQLPLAPRQSSDTIGEVAFELDQMKQVDKKLPFEVICTDIRQLLIKKDGPITAGNTIDWQTSIQIKDEGGTREAVVSMNKPFDYRGYRFFQASFVAIGRARNITLRLKDEKGATQDVTLPRDGSKTLANGTNIKFADFRGSFNVGQEDPNVDTSTYPNPGAILQVTAKDGKPQTAYAFSKSVGDIPIASNAVGGYKYQLVDFEKVADQHILSVQKDPGSNVVYIGFALLFIALAAVFFFSHKRVWTAIVPHNGDGYKLIIGGNTNRNQPAFEEKINRFCESLKKFLSH